MDIVNMLTNQVVLFARSEPLITLIAVVILAFFVYRKPFFSLGVFCLALILLGVFLVIMDASRSGVSKKERMIHREETPRNKWSPPGLLL